MSLGVGFDFSKVQARPIASLFLLSVEQDVKFSATALELCLSASHCGDRGLTF